MERALPVRGETVDFLAADGRIYGRVPGQGLEIVMSDRGECKTAVGGKRGSGESPIEMEARMIAENFSAQWAQVRGAKIVVSDGAVKLIAPLAVASKETVETVFNRAQVLSQGERDRLMARDRQRVEQSAVAKNFETKISETKN